MHVYIYFKNQLQRNQRAKRYKYWAYQCPTEGHSLAGQIRVLQLQATKLFFSSSTNYRYLSNSFYFQEGMECKSQLKNQHSFMQTKKFIARKPSDFSKAQPFTYRRIKKKAQVLFFLVMFYLFISICICRRFKLRPSFKDYTMKLKSIQQPGEFLWFRCDTPQGIQPGHLTHLVLRNKSEEN